MDEHIAHIRESDNREQTLEQHLLGVAQLCRENAEKIGLADIGDLLGLAHDIGKYRKIFQDYIRLPDGRKDQDVDDSPDDLGAKKKALRGKIDHSTSGAQLLWRDLRVDKQSFVSSFLLQLLPLTLASHHSGMIDCIVPDGENFFIKRMCKADDLTGLSEVEKVMPMIISKRIDGLVEDQVFAQRNKVNHHFPSAERKGDGQRENYV